MKSLKTTYAGLELKNPIIVGSCEIGSSAERCAKAQEAGAGAIVLKSLFEEDIVRRTNKESSAMDSHSEGADYLQAYHSSQAVESYTKLIKEAKELCTIPIIASLNCHTPEAWVEYSKSISQAGADAIQLNIMSFNYSAKESDGEWESRVLGVVKSIKNRVDTPLIIKLSPCVTNPVSLINKLYSYDVESVALFNTPYPVNIDVENICFTKSKGIGAARSSSESLRWIALSSPQVPNIDYALCSGVSSAEDVIAALLVGASATEVVGAIYTGDMSWITQSLEWIEQWLSRHGFESIDEFKGKLNASQDENKEFILRWQYLTT